MFGNEQWYSSLPIGWSIQKFKYVASLYTGNSIKDSEKDNYTDAKNARPYIATKHIEVDNNKIDYENGLYVKYNDTSFRIAKRGSTLMCIEGGSAGKKKGFLTQDVSFVNKLCCFKPSFRINSKYLFYYLMSPNYEEDFKTRITGLIGGVSVSELMNMSIIMPPLLEQQAIADYLDKTCSKIDEIIAEAKASINEYEKLKQATIDENIFGYDSVYIKLRQLGSLKNGLNFSHSDGVANIKFLGVGCFKDNMILSKVDDFADEHIDFEISEEYLLSNGDIVFVRSNGSKELVGRSIMVENIDYTVTFSGFCIRFRNMHTELVDNQFLLYYFRTTHFKQSLLKYSNDSTNINNLNQEMLNAIHINAPVINEQKLLVKKLEKQVFVIDSLISEKESLINDLEAYKKSLIYEVVTGKRRVV